MSGNTDPAKDNAHADIGIVSALPIELGAFHKRCDRLRKYTGGRFVFRGGRYDGIRIAFVETGVGYARARNATQLLMEAHTPSWILSCGFSGSLCDEIRVGSIVVADSICDVHGNHVNLEMSFPADPERRLYVGRFVTADEHVRRVEDKRQLAADHDAIATDLESLAVAQVCQESGTRFLSIRAISDDLSADVPPEVLTVLGATGTQRFGAAVGAVWKRPQSYKDIWELREVALRAADNLARFLDGVVTQLHASDK